MKELTYNDWIQNPTPRMTYAEELICIEQEESNDR